MNERSAVFAVLTPPGAAAVATVGVAGSDAWNIIRRCFRPAGSQPLPALPESDRLWYGQFGGPPGDTVVISARAAGAQTAVEIHSHGGPEVVRLVTDELANRGAVSECTAGFLRAAHTSRRCHQAEIELSRASTFRTAAILLDQCQGAFAGALAAIETALKTDTSRARELIATLASRSALGRHLTRPWRVAVAGAPNVGKSSLVNALVGYQRSVVTATPGTTRDAVATAVAIDGWPVELIDTAGQHATDDDLEGQGIAHGHTAVAAADLCLWVVDATVEPELPTTDVGKCLLAINKSDLTPSWDIAAIPNASIVSARTGAGLADLCDQISRRLVPDPPPPGAAVPFTPELADNVALIEMALTRGDIEAARAAIEAAASSL
jgi:tRNA modification GTPase